MPSPTAEPVPFAAGDPLAAVLPLGFCIAVVFVPLALGLAGRRRSRLGFVLYALSVFAVIVWTIEGAPLGDGFFHRPETFPQAHWAIATLALSVASCSAFLLRGGEQAQG